MKTNALIATLFIIVIITVIVLTSAVSFKSLIPFFGKIIAQQAVTMCNESDSGVFFYAKGTISLCTDNSCITQAEDFCIGDVVTEYYCTEKNEIKTVNLKCPFSCDDGACMTIGQKLKPKQTPQPAETPKENKTAEQEVKEIICNEGWTCASKIKVYQDISCAWIKEEYCKYGCLEGECKTPTFWEKFLLWLEGQII